MQIVYDMSKLLDVADDGVLHVMFCEPVVIATQEDDVIGGRYRIPRVDSRPGVWNSSQGLVT